MLPCGELLVPELFTSLKCRTLSDSSTSSGFISTFFSIDSSTSSTSTKLSASSFSTFGEEFSLFSTFFVEFSSFGDGSSLCAEFSTIVGKFSSMVVASVWIVCSKKITNETLNRQCVYVTDGRFA